MGYGERRKIRHSLLRGRCAGFLGWWGLGLAVLIAIVDDLGTYFSESSKD